MSTVSMGLKKRQVEIKTIQSKRNCISCKGQGSVYVGKIPTINKGILDFHKDCNDCNGEGYHMSSIRKLNKKQSVHIV